MEAQLQLIPSSEGAAGHSGDSTSSSRPAAEWRLDEATRARGRAGIAMARQALQQARRSIPGSADPVQQRTAA